MKKEAFSKTSQKKIRAEAKRHIVKGLVLYLNFDKGHFGYQARIYRIPGAYGEKERWPGKFHKTKFFAKSKYPTWMDAANDAKLWLKENEPSENGKS